MIPSRFTKNLSLAGVRTLGNRICPLELLHKYRTVSAVMEGAVDVDPTDEAPTDLVEKLAREYKDIPKDGHVYWKDVRSAYPDIASMLQKEFFKGRDKLAVKDIVKLIDGIEPDDSFWISLDRWDGMQKDLNQEQIVVQLNLDKRLLNEIEKNKTAFEFFSRFYDEILEGEHPVHGQTIAWARVYKFPDKWIIEEIQSDLFGSSPKIADVANEHIESILDFFDSKEQAVLGDFFTKHFKDWDSKLVATVIEMARNEAVKDIWIFDEDYKKRYLKSKSKLKRYYKTVPRDFGFKRATLKVQDKEIPAWHRAVAQLKGEYTIMRRKITAESEEAAIVIQDRTLPVDTAKDLIRSVYKSILKKLGRYDDHTWSIFDAAIKRMGNDELKLEWEAILDGTVSNIVETISNFGEQDEMVQQDIINIFEGLARPYFQQYKGDVPKEDLEWAHKQLRDYFGDLKKKKILENIEPEALPEPRKRLQGRLSSKRRLHENGIKTYRGGKTKASYIKRSDLAKAISVLVV